MSAFSMRVVSLAFSAAWLAVFVPACATDTVVDAANYDATCKVATDCTTVFGGDVCGCNCQYEAINKSQEAAFNAAVVEAHEGCGDTGLSCVACDDVKVDCVSGKCAVVP